MTRQLTENELMASVFLQLVLQPCVALKVNKISLSQVMNSVPRNEQLLIQSGIDALLAHGLIGKDSNDVGLSQLGNVFLAYTAAVTGSSPTLEEDIQDHPILTPILAAIAIDLRFVPPPSFSQTSSRKVVTKVPQNSQTNGIWNVWTILLFVMLALGVIKLFSAIMR